MRKNCLFGLLLAAKVLYALLRQVGLVQLCSGRFELYTLVFGFLRRSFGLVVLVGDGRPHSHCKGACSHYAVITYSTELPEQDYDMRFHFTCQVHGAASAEWQ